LAAALAAQARAVPARRVAHRALAAVGLARVVPVQGVAAARWLPAQ